MNIVTEILEVLFLVKESTSIRKNSKHIMYTVAIIPGASGA